MMSEPTGASPRTREQIAKQLEQGAVQRQKRALLFAEEIVNFSGMRMLTGQIPGLAQMIVSFAKNELRHALKAMRSDGLMDDAAENFYPKRSEKTMPDTPRTREQIAEQLELEAAELRKQEQAHLAHATRWPTLVKSEETMAALVGARAEIFEGAATLLRSSVHDVGLETVCRECGAIADIAKRYDPPAVPDGEGAPECQRCLWKRGDASELAQLLSEMSRWAEIDLSGSLHVNGEARSGGYRGRAEKARRALELGLEALQRLQEGAPVTTPQAWQAIETYDGEAHSVLVVDERGNVGEAHLCEGEGWWWVNNHPSDSWGSRIYPKLWMPLPVPPQVEARAQQIEKGTT